MEKLYRILIIDDEPYNIKLLTSFLRKDYKIMVAKDGKTGLKAAEGPNPPDLILLDIIMPGIDGYEVCRNLKDNEKTKNIPVIFLTAVSEAMDAAKAFDVGAVDYITKPFYPVTVMARVKTHLRLSTTVRELKDAIEEVKALSGLLPICAHCKKIRDDKGYWKQIEVYISEHSEAKFSHSICKECMKTYYPDFKILEE